MNLSNLLKDPLDILLLLIYVTGVLILVYSAMQLIHGFLYKDKAAKRSGIKTLIISLVLLAPRLTYQYLRIDGSDYKKSVKTALSSIASVHESESASVQAELKAQMDALSSRLADEAYDVELQTSVEKDADGDYTIRNLSATKAASGDSTNADIIIISTSLDGLSSDRNAPQDDSPDDEVSSEEPTQGDAAVTDFSYAAELSVMEALAHRLSGYDSSVELRFLVSSDKRHGQDAARSYIDSLDSDVKDRIICAIDYDMKSLSDYTGLLGHTVNGRNNPVSKKLISSIKKMTGQKVDIRQLKDAGYIAFHLEDIPSVHIEQATVEKSSAAKSIGDLNIDQIADVAASLGDTILPVVKSGDSAFMADLLSLDASNYCSGSFIKDTDHFAEGSSIRAIEETYGTALRSTGAYDAEGNELYSGKLYLLTWDDASDVMFHVRDEKLKKITVDTGSITVPRDGLSQILNNLFGNSQKTETGLVWTDTESGASYYVEDSSSAEALEDLTSGGYSFYIKATA